MDGSRKKTLRDSVLLVAEHRRGHGTGHLRRCAHLAGELGLPLEWLLPSDRGAQWYTRTEALELSGIDQPLQNVRWIDAPQGPYGLVIVDRRSIGLEELEALNCEGLLVGLDAADDLRRFASFVVDTLPTAPGVSVPNIADTGFLPLPEESAESAGSAEIVRGSWPVRCERVLAAFGGEDRDAHACDLATALVTGLSAGTTQAPAVDLLVHHGQAPRGVQPVAPQRDLARHLARYDLVITHYGLLAWEALWARVPVLLLNPARYHQVLADRAGFFSVARKEALAPAIARYDEIVHTSRRLRPERRRSLGEFIRGLNTPVRLNSPSGGERYQPAVQRFPEATFFLNRTDGILYRQNYGASAIEYDHDYFHQEYLQQYGKTYLEDFAAIERVGHGRIRRILSLLRRRNRAMGGPPRLLDIGCAYGPFLKAAHAAGCEVQGLEINGEAVRHVREELKLDARQGDLAQLSEPLFAGLFDIVTMWYVIEHVADLDLLLKNIAVMMRRGAILAFSTPHGKGVSARRSLRSFLEKSPTDHFTIWDIAATRNVLRAHGFRLLRVRVTGHHPERYLLPSAAPLFRIRPILAILRFWSRIMRRGDTFEAYAERL